MKKIILFIVAIFLAIALYTFTIKGVAGNPRESDFKNKLDQQTMPLELSPERGRFAQVISLVDDHRFDLNKTLADAVYPDVGFHQTRFYAYFAPGISILAAPFYIVGKIYNLSQVATFSYSSFIAILAGTMIYLIGRKILKLSAWASIFAALTYMFGSTSWAYAVTLYQHQTTAFLILSSFFAAWYFKQEKRFSVLAAFWIWIAAGIAILIDYPNALFMAPVLIYFAFSAFKLTNIKIKSQIVFRPVAIVSVVGFLLIGAFHLYYNSSNFGSFYRVSGSLPSYTKIVENNLNINDPEINSEIKNLEKTKNPIHFFSQEKFLFGIYTLLVSPDRGIFLFSPIFILAFIGIIISIRKNNAEISTIIATVIVIFFLYSSWGDPWGGWAFGPRYLIPAMAFMVLFISYLLTRFNKICLKLIAFILFAYSSAVAIIGVLTTNAVPPKIEADYLHTGYNFLLNWKILLDNRSSSYVYNTYFAHKITLLNYGEAIYAVVMLVAFIILFIWPIFEKHKNEN